MTKKVKAASWKGYAVSYIDASIKAKIKEHVMTPTAAVKWICSIVDEPYKFALKYEPDGSSYVASLYCHEAGHPNSGLMLAVRHVDIMVAITALSILHGDVYDEEWPTRDGNDW